MAEDLLSLEGRVALITGAGSGIGRGAAVVFARHGAKVALVGRTEEELCDARDEIRAKGGQAECFVADVADATAIREAVEGCARRFGRLDIVFANAGINGVWAPLEEIAEDEYDRTMDINLKGTFLTVQAATPHLRAQGRGAVLVTSSVNGTRTFANTGATVYSMTKAGQVAMVKMLAIELGKHKIRVNAICPGAIETNIGENTQQRDTEDLGVKTEFPEGSNPLTGDQAGNIEQVGRLALFLASDAADHINGEIVYIDGGASLIV